MTKIKLGVISNPIFTSTMSKLIKQNVPIKTAFKLKTLINTFNDELKKFEELRIGIISKHCVNMEDGNPKLDENNNYIFEGNGMQLVQKELGELMNVEIEVKQVNVSELGDITLSVNELMALGDVINEA